MSLEKIYIGSSPYEEDCAQVGQPDFHTKSKAELQAFKDQLQRLFPAPEGACYQVVWSNHDYGRYGEVCAVFDPSNEEHTDWAYIAEDGCATWDDEAKAFLAESAKNWQAQMANKR